MPVQTTDYKVTKHREHLTGEHRIGDGGQLLLFILFMATWITDTFFFGYSTMLNDHVPLAVRIPIGIVILIFAFFLARTGMSIVFGNNNHEPGVIRKSVFSILRHPIYMGEILLYLGLLVISISLAATGIWVITIIFLHFISRYEERLLLQRFGEEYRQYMKDVPMWIPRFRKK